jgi:PEP-CTERM motif
MTKHLKRFIPLAAFLLLLSSAAMADSSSNNDFGTQTTQGLRNHSRWDNSGAQDGRPPVTVPEPSSIALTGMGLLGVLEVIRRKARL